LIPKEPLCVSVVVSGRGIAVNYTNYQPASICVANSAGYRVAIFMFCLCVFLFNDFCQPSYLNFHWTDYASCIDDNKARRASVELVDALGLLPVTRVTRHRDSVMSNSEM